MTKKGLVFIFRAKKAYSVSLRGLDNVATLVCPTLSGCHHSRGLKTRRVLALAVPLRNVHGTGPEGSDALTINWSSTLGLKSPFFLTNPDPDPTEDRDKLEEPGQLAAQPLLPRLPSLMACLAAPDHCSLLLIT